MEHEEQIMLVRQAYDRVKERFMGNDFMQKAAAYSHVYRQKAQDKLQLLFQLSSLIENALLREEASRAVMYLSVFALQLQQIETEMIAVCSKICAEKNIPM